MDPITGRWARDGAEIVVAVQRAFSTPRGARIMRRWLGMSRAQMLDRPVTPQMLGPTTAALAESLRYEPRVRLNRLGLESADAQGAVGLACDVRVIADAATVRVAL